MPRSKETQLYGKYQVTKTNGSPVDPLAQYFVLRLDTDDAARVAVLVYADRIAGSEPLFANELREWVYGIDPDLDNRQEQGS